MAAAHDPEHVSMTFGEHLEELRRRLIYALIGLGVALAITTYFGRDLIQWLLVPLNHVQRSAGLPAQTVGLSVATGFSVFLKVTIIAALILDTPWALYQLWKFIAAGLYASEQKAVRLIAPFSAAMTAMGVLFTYYIMLPVCLTFLIGFSISYPAPEGDAPAMIDRLTGSVAWFSGGTHAPVEAEQTDTATLTVVPMLQKDPDHPVDGQMWINTADDALHIHYGKRTHTVSLASPLMRPMIEIGAYINFVAIMLLGIVVAFQVPVVMLLAGWSQLVNPGLLTRYRKHCILGCAIIGAVLTPADPISMFVLAIPLWGLFELGLVLMRITYRGGTSS